MMLRPTANWWRDRSSLDGLWRFAVDREGVGRDQRWWRAPLPGRTEVAVPASYNDLFADGSVRDHVGDVWYQTSVHVPVRWRGERIVLRFDAATHRAVVWVGETRVAEHEGGYTPFEADVTDVVSVGAENRVTVVVDNRLSWESIPPGYVEDTPDGTRQRYYHDFFNYAGLHRSVWLYTTPQARVDDVTVVTGLDGATGTVDYEAVTSGGVDGLETRAVLRDAEGTEVARATGASGTLTVADVHPWRPGEGYLHELTVELWSGDAQVDAYSLNVGVRTVEVRGTEFLINGEPFYFTGFGMHEDHPVRGKGHDDASMIHDFALLDWIGANSLRTSHYPYAEEILDYAHRITHGERPGQTAMRGRGADVRQGQSVRDITTLI